VEGVFGKELFVEQQIEVAKIAVYKGFCGVFFEGISEHGIRGAQSNKSWSMTKLTNLPMYR
jgi:hypothetical protein